MSFLSHLDWRYATKKYQEKKVSTTDLHKILEAIRKAPSALGLQPYHVIVVSGEKKNELIVNSKQTDKLNMSHLLVFCIRTDIDTHIEIFLDHVARAQNTTREAIVSYEKMIKDGISKKSGDSLHAWITSQAYIALGFGLAAAAELGIDSSPMEGFDPKSFADILHLPPHLEPVVLLGLGYRDLTDRAQPEFRAKVRLPEDYLFSFIS